MTRNLYTGRENPPDPATDSERVVISHAMGKATEALKVVRSMVLAVRVSDDSVRALEVIDAALKVLR
ncbi:hypothetical protein R54767_04693 [Paraburkholderia gardini]|uniref:ANTAR domain-containing protein n=1 Tax=Paraburkholderia gardini TaxID=2823469 RepID=A0ABN7QQQ8_9BURK|nr:hypothetical protein R54767_04693 [Paraburkholderia gardini]